MEDGGSSSGSVSGVTAGLEAAITEKQETEAKLAQAELRIAQLEQHINSGGGAPPSGLMSPRYSIVFISVMWQDFVLIKLGVINIYFGLVSVLVSSWKAS